MLKVKAFLPCTLSLKSFIPKPLPLLMNLPKGSLPWANRLTALLTIILKHHTLKEINTIGMKDTDMVKAIIEDMATLIEMERQLLDITANAGDDGTNDMVNRFMQFKEKNTWMLRSFVNED
jgi:hypothetical protein